MAPLLYSIVSEDTLHSMVDTFYACMRLPIQVIDEHGEFLAVSGQMSSFCRCFQDYLPPNDSCEKMHISASKKAVSYTHLFLHFIPLISNSIPPINRMHPPRATILFFDWHPIQYPA